MYRRIYYLMRGHIIKEMLFYLIYIILYISLALGFYILKVNQQYTDTFSTISGVKVQLWNRSGKNLSQEELLRIRRMQHVIQMDNWESEEGDDDFCQLIDIMVDHPNSLPGLENQLQKWFPVEDNYEISDSIKEAAANMSYVAATLQWLSRGMLQLFLGCVFVVACLIVIVNSSGYYKDIIQYKLLGDTSIHIFQMLTIYQCIKYSLQFVSILAVCYCMITYGGVDVILTLNRMACGEFYHTWQELDDKVLLATRFADIYFPILMMLGSMILTSEIVNVIGIGLSTERMFNCEK